MGLRIGTGPGRFGYELRRLRKAAGLTQWQLVELSGVSMSTISQLERGSRAAPQAASAVLLADALGLAGQDREAFFATIRAERIPPGRRPPQAAPLPAAGHAIRGRDEAVAEIERLLDGGARWITLTGEGGIGKTRLALEIAHRVEAAGERVVFWVSGEPLREPAEVLPALALAAGVPERPGAPAIERIARATSERPGLAVLDNMEHLLDAASGIEAALAAAPALAVLATTRERFNAREETLVTVDPLPVPDSRDVREIAANPAVRIFFERSGQAGGDPPVNEDLLAAARIVRTLDGLPLAVELAAAQRPTLSPSAIADVLEQAGVRGLGRWRSGPERTRSMEQAIRWSADLLPGDARALFRMLSVFRGGFTIAAAAAVAAAAGRPAVAAALPALITASLVRETSRSAAPPRFAMLEPVRMVAALELAEAGEERTARDAHAANAVASAVAASARQLGGGGGEREALAFFAAERANLLVALDHLLATGQPARALPLASALGFWWEHVGPARVGLPWLRRAIAADDGSGPARDRWHARFIATLLALEAGEYGDMRRFAEEALEIAENAGDLEGEATANIAVAIWEQTDSGDVDGALRRLDRAIGMAERAFASDNRAWLPLAFGSNLRGAFRYYGTGDVNGALPDFERGQTVIRAHGALTLLRLPRLNMAAALQAVGRRDEALAAVREALADPGPHVAPVVLANAAMRLASLLSEEPGPRSAAAAARLLGALDVVMDRQGYRADWMMEEENARTLARLAPLKSGIDREISRGRHLAEIADGEPDLLSIAYGA